MAEVLRTKNVVRIKDVEGIAPDILVEKEVVPEQKVPKNQHPDGQNDQRGQASREPAGGIAGDVHAELFFPWSLAPDIKADAGEPTPWLCLLVAAI